MASTPLYPVIAELGARRFVRYVLASKRAFERGNNSGDPKILAQQQAIETAQAAKAADVARAFGCSCDWPGLYPVLNRGDRSEYSTGSAINVARFFAESLR